MSTVDDIRRAANPDCPECGGTGFVEGSEFPALVINDETVATFRNTDRVCVNCVPFHVYNYAWPKENK